MISRRGIIGGIGALLAAPAVVKAASLMPVRGIIMPVNFHDGRYVSFFAWDINCEECYFRVFLPRANVNILETDGSFPPIP